MATQKGLPVVVVGCGGMSKTWINSAINTPGLRLAGLVDVRREAAEAMADKFNQPRDIVFNTMKQAIKATDAKIVFDVTIPEAHDKVTIEALKAGCHVLGEKPMAVTMAKARKMVETAKKAGKTYAVIQNRRYDANVVAVHKFLKSKKLGGIEEVHSDFYLGPHFGGFRDAMAHPLILDMAIHTFDTARYISGADPVAVYCHAFNPKRSWYKGDASAVAIFEMSNGIVYTYRGSWCAEGMSTSWNTDWRVICNKGTLKWDGEQAIKAQIVSNLKEKGFWRPVADVEVPIKPMEHNGHAAIIREFVKCIKTGGRPQTHCEDNIKSLAMVHAAVKSDATGKCVKVTW